MFKSRPLVSLMGSCKQIEKKQVQSKERENLHLFWMYKRANLIPKPPQRYDVASTPKTYSLYGENSKILEKTR
jgi:hypothetical protein